MKKKKSRKRGFVLTDTFVDEATADPKTLAEDRRLCAEQLKRTRQYLNDPQPAPTVIAVPPIAKIWNPSNESLRGIAKRLLSDDSFYKADKTFVPLSGYSYLLLERLDFYMRRAHAAGDIKLALIFAVEFGRCLQTLALSDYVRSAVLGKAHDALSLQKRIERLKELLPRRDQLLFERFVEQKKKDTKLSYEKFRLTGLKKLYNELRENKDTRELARALKPNTHSFIRSETIRQIVEAQRTLLSKPSVPSNS